MFLEVAREWKAAGKLKCRKAWLEDCQQRKASLQRKTHFDNVPVKPQRVYEEMNQVFGKDTTYVSTIGLSQIAGAQFLHVYKPRHWIKLRPGRPAGAGPSLPRWAWSKPTRNARLSRCPVTTTSSS